MPAQAAVKAQYGGTLKIAGELLDSINSTQLFEVSETDTVPLFPIAYTRTDTSLTLDLSTLDPTTLLEVEQAVAKLKEASHPCHWIFDYPYFTHQHPTSIEFQDGKLSIRSSEPDYLRAILSSNCVLPEDFRFLDAFDHTQFAFEANPACLSGRPFVNSIIPVSVDPMNPYLYFKLGDADVIPIPEDRFAQISKDPDALIQAGPRFYVYLRTFNLTDEQMVGLLAALNLAEMTSAVLNGHAEILLSAADDAAGINLNGILVHLSIPKEDPYRLLGERMEIQWTQAGAKVDHNAPASGAPGVELIARQIDKGDLDLFRYFLLREDPAANTDQPWYEQWDDLEASGKLIPLMIYASRIAVRKNIRNLQIRGDGMPDFSNCWIQTP